MRSLFLERSWRKDVQQLLHKTRSEHAGILSEEDLLHLPEPVQHYIRSSGAVGQPRPRCMRVVLEGEMRGRSQDWFSFRAVQYNFFKSPARLFFIKARILGLPVPGYHRYLEAKASMDIRLAGLLPLVYKSGEMMDQAETVTFLNDACLMAPAFLADPGLEWEAIDGFSSRVIFSNRSLRVSAILEFNNTGQLVNFYSDDRYEVNEGKRYPFSTPCRQYRDFGGYTLASEGEAVWQYPDGPFIYGRFRTISIDYNTNWNN